MSEENPQEIKQELVEKKNKAKQIRIRNYETISDLKNLYSQLNNDKAKRDEFTSQVKLLKEEREDVIKKVELLETKFKELLDLIHKEEKSLEVPYFQLKQELEKLEWQQQTESNPKAEKALSTKIKEVEKQLKKAEKIKPIQEQLNAVRKELNQIKRLETDLRNKINFMAKKSQFHHKQFLEMQTNVDKLRGTLGEGLQKLDETNKEIKVVSTEFKEILDSDREKKDKENQEYRDFQDERKQKLKEKLEEIKSEAHEIYDKFKKGEKLKFEDIQKLQAAGLL